MTVDIDDDLREVVRMLTELEGHPLTADEVHKFAGQAARGTYLPPEHREMPVVYRSKDGFEMRPAQSVYTGRALNLDQRRAFVAQMDSENIVVHSDGRRERVGGETRGGSTTRTKADDGALDVAKARLFLSGGNVPR